jgi:hypothetical protein
MTTVIHFIELDVHKESVAVTIAPSNPTEFGRGATLRGALIADAGGASSERLRWPWAVGMLRQDGKSG